MVTLAGSAKGVVGGRGATGRLRSAKEANDGIGWVKRVEPFADELKASTHAVQTYRYLRLAMIMLVIGLGGSVAYEWQQVGRACFQTSISAYYYTPARGFFVGALMAIGVCLVSLRGNIELEDVLLNIAGMFAPVVALVPTPNPGTCTSLPGSTEGRSANVANNMSALFLVGAVGLIALAVTGMREWKTKSKTPGPSPLIAFIAALIIWTVALVIFLAARHFYLDTAHYTAAVAMFMCIIGVVSLNAFAFGRKPGNRSYANRYSVVAVLMVASVVGMGGYRWAFGWDHAVLWIEASLIALFATFWLMQTAELWESGLRFYRPAPKT